MLSELKKLKIVAFETIKFTDIIGEYTVLYNPTGYTQKYEITYEEKKGKNSTSEPQKFGRIKPQVFQFELIFDGTGVSGGANSAASKKRDFVAREIKKFLMVTGHLSGDTHRPPFLRIFWGSMIVTCVLKSADISYSLFHSNGFPLRAKIKATFAEAIDEKLQSAKDRKASPDLTHLRTVKDKDSLPMLSYEIYGDVQYYLKIAKRNNLINFRNLKTGTTLEFPPLKSLER